MFYLVIKRYLSLSNHTESGLLLLNISNNINNEVRYTHQVRYTRSEHHFYRLLDEYKQREISVNKNFHSNCNTNVNKVCDLNAFIVNNMKLLEILNIHFLGHKNNVKILLELRQLGFTKTGSFIKL